MKRMSFANKNTGAEALLLCLFLLFCASACQAQTPPATVTNQVDSPDYVCVERGPYSKVWQSTLLYTNANGNVATNIQSYTELATGISYLSNGQYVDSVEQVDLVPGGAQAIQGRHQVQWALNANTPGGAVTVTTPDAKQLSSTVFGLAYYDVATGSNAAIGQLKNCNGSVVEPNQVLYADAFSNVTADISYTYTKAGLSQDIVLRQAPPPPESYGLSDETTILQIYTAFFNVAQPQMTAVTNGNAVDDQVLDFGDMKMGIGQAFLVNGQDAPVPAGMVTKQWVQINNGTYLVESIPYSAISNQLQQLPHASNLKPGRGSVRRLALLDANSFRPGGSAKGHEPMKLAKAEKMGRRLRVDYELLSSSTNLTLQGDTTYFVSGNVNVTGTMTIEGGTVVKYTNLSTAQITATNVVCLTGPYNPGVFSSMNDNSVGTAISNSTGTPSQGLANYINFGNLGTNSLVFRNLRFSYANEGINGVISSLGTNSIEIWDSQFIHCGSVFYGNDAVNEWFPVNIYNVLCFKCDNGFAGRNNPGQFAFNVVNATVDQLAAILTGGGVTGNACHATNSIFTGSSTLGINLVSCCTNTTNTGFFTNVGAGSYYLVAGSTNRNVGSTNINSALLTDLQTLTTEAPVTNIYGLITNDYTFSPQVQRDTNASPDRGYHYAPIDYALNIEISNATVTVIPGTVLATCGPQYGVYLYTNGIFDCEGTATSPNYLVRYNTVQEQSNTNWETTGWVVSFETPAHVDTSWANFAFTVWSVLEQGGQIIGQDDVCPLALQDCQFNGGVITTSGLVLTATNCLFHRANCTLTDYNSGNASPTFGNNLFLGGELAVKHWNSGQFSFRDNLFDQTAVTLIGSINICSSNAYVTTNFGFLSPTNGDIFLINSPAYQTGASGVYYYPTNQTNLIHEGSQPAEDAGLYFYTVLTNNTIEGANTVSIGFHYVAVDSNGVPLGAFGGGVADYLEDPSGNGVLNPFLIFDQSEYPNEPQVRLGYWRFNTTNWTSESGVSPTTKTGLNPSNSFSGTAVSLTHTDNSSQLVYPITTNGQSCLNLANGTIRFWFQPNWSSGSSSAPTEAVFLDVGTGSNTWQFGEQLNGSDSLIQLDAQSNQYWQHYTFDTQGRNGAVVDFQSNLWYQIVLTYSPTNVALYTNGVLLATANVPPELAATSNSIFDVGDGNIFYPSLSAVSNSFSFGSQVGRIPVMGQLDELETFNYPLTAQQVAAGFPYFGGNATNMLDTYYVGRSDMLQTYVDGVFPPLNYAAAPCRLGYWRFDSPLLYAEQGQMPLSLNNVSLTPSWSGTALVIDSTTNSQVTYPAVGSNGWANINCENGCLRFWFKLNGSLPTSYAPFVYMGSFKDTNEWILELTSSNTINFVTSTYTYFVGGGLTITTVLSAPASCLSTSNWTQIVLNYGTTSCALYTNSVLAATNSTGNQNWPILANRELGMVIGNDRYYEFPINGQFEEMETFNYQLTASEIATNFQMVARVDSNLNGIPDLLEDIVLPTARPFLGAPVVITGTIEAEQFDMGGPGVGYYHSGAGNPPSSYRPTGMLINACNDLGGGYCLDQTQSNDWAQYTINVLVPQTYMVEVRAEAIGTNTGGVFQCTFTNGFGVLTNGAGFSNSTSLLTITSTNWTNVTNVVYLTNGTYAMKLHCLTNAPGSGSSNVGRFNYISIYPYWTPPTNGPGSNTVSTNAADPPYLAPGSNYFTAYSNSLAIQAAVNSLPTNGGTVTIPAGTWYVSQAYPNDANGAHTNAVVNITNNNIEIAGEGTNDTFLIANNRATTIFCLGQDPHQKFYQCTNFTLCNITLEAQPHEVAFPNPTNGYTNFFELGQLIDSDSQGSIAVFYGYNTNQCSYNICISNCVFLHGVKSLVTCDSSISNFMVRSCEFIPWDANCFFAGTTNNGATNTTNAWTSNTTNWQGAVVGIFGAAFNMDILENTYIGNNNLAPTNFGYVSTNLYYNGIIAPDGFIWLQYGGNLFVARNTISNYLLEGIQVNSGPNSVVGNTYNTLASLSGTSALSAFGGDPGVTETPLDWSTCFVGNSVYGGRQGARGAQDHPYTLNFSGNSLMLYPAYDETNDYPGAAVGVVGCLSANVCGNTLTNGGHGFIFSGGCSNALILNNNFSGATYRGIGYGSAGDYLNASQIFGNTLCEGVSFHVQATYTNSFGWFLGGNTNVDTNSNIVPLFLDPASSAVHIYQ